MLALPCGVLDCKNYDLIRRIIHVIIYQVGISARHQLAHTVDLLASAELRKLDKMLERFCNCGPHTQRGLWTMFANVFGDVC
jgi:hypothetical protein